MLELDLIGRRVLITDADARLLLAAAEAGSGSSIGSRDLATRLKDLPGPPAQSQRPLVFSRPEVRALQRMMPEQIESGDHLDNLRQTVSELLAAG